MIEFILWILLIMFFCVGASYIAKRQEEPVFLAATFASLVVIANVVAVKQIEIWGFFAPAAVIAYSVTFLLTDMLSEFYSKEEAHRAVWAGFYANVLLVFVVMITAKMTPAPFWQGQEAYMQTLGMVPRIVIASMTAYLISQHADVIQFHFWKKRTGGRYLWLRNNASTMVSQFLDTLIFITLAFYGIFPIKELIIGQYIVKLCIAALDTPFMYLGRWIYSR